jgi:hypothetical protein
MAWSIRQLQQMAIAISAISIVYNGAEGAVSIYFGNEGSSIALVAFGVQSLVEIVSAALVLWRFCCIALPGDETKGISEDVLKKERFATIGVGVLLGLLTVGTIASSVNSIIVHDHPETADYNLIVSGAALFFMIIIWAPKPWLARELNSSAMAGEAMCSLSCMSMTVVLLIGSFIYKIWPGGWWVDNATAIILAMFFGKESVAIIRWGMSESFNGGCCGACGPNTARSCQSGGAACGAAEGACASSSSCSGPCARSCTSDLAEPLLAAGCCQAGAVLETACELGQRRSAESLAPAALAGPCAADDGGGHRACCDESDRPGATCCGAAEAVPPTSCTAATCSGRPCPRTTPAGACCGAGAEPPVPPISAAANIDCCRLQDPSNCTQPPAAAACCTSSAPPPPPPGEARIEG